MKLRCVQFPATHVMCLLLNCDRQFLKTFWKQTVFRGPRAGKSYILVLFLYFVCFYFLGLYCLGIKSLFYKILSKILFRFGCLLKSCLDFIVTLRIYYMRQKFPLDSQSFKDVSKIQMQIDVDTSTYLS